MIYKVVITKSAEVTFYKEATYIAEDSAREGIPMGGGSRLFPRVDKQYLRMNEVLGIACS